MGDDTQIGLIRCSPMRIENYREHAGPGFPNVRPVAQLPEPGCYRVVITLSAPVSIYAEARTTLPSTTEHARWL